MPSAAPRRLGKYDLVARIAKGGMAEIYLARQHGMVGFSRLVVVKCILPHLAEEPQFVRMFLEEARIAALISHPNVVQIYDVGEFEGHYFIAMEYINGPPVATVVRKLRAKRAAIPWTVAAEIVAQACDGLHAAHELRDYAGELLQLVHRDVSPHNLMIGEGGLVKLVDFGIAKAQISTVQTRTGAIKGKYPYMSPEQCRGDPLDRRTDLFSLGAVFFELVSGRRLFQRQTDLMTLKAITEEPIPFAREVQPDVPEEVSAFVYRCLARDRDARFATAAAMGAGVRKIVSVLAAESGPGVVARYLEQHHSELLQTRAEALKRAGELPVEGDRVPLMDGLGSRSGTAEGEVERGSASPSRTRPTAATRKISRRRVALVVAGAAVVLGAGAAGLLYRLRRGPALEGPPILFGLPPSFPSEVTQREMRPFLDYLGRRVGRPVELRVVRSYHALRDELVAGQLHVANMPPLQFVLAQHARPDLKVLVSNLYEGSGSYQALLITRDDAKIEKMAELKGKRFCYVDRESTSGYLLPRLYLRKQGLDPDRLFASTRFSGDHIAVMKEVIAGRCDAGAVYSGAMNVAYQHGVASSRLRLLTAVGQLPYDLICASPKLPAPLLRALERALRELDPKRDLGREVVGDTFRISGFTAPRIADFDDVREAARSEGLLK
jgi:serine/threonine-protein kinase